MLFINVRPILLRALPSLKLRADNELRRPRSFHRRAQDHDRRIHRYGFQTEYDILKEPTYKTEYFQQEHSRRRRSAKEMSAECFRELFFPVIQAL